MRPTARALVDAMTEPKEAKAFWASHCIACGHDLHPMNVCSAIIGGSNDGPDYCPCDVDYPALAAAYQRLVRIEFAGRAFIAARRTKQGSREMLDRIADLAEALR